VSALTLILIVASVMLGVGLIAVLAWLVSTSYLTRIERRLARRKGLYRALVGELAARDRALLEPEIRRLGTLLDLEALEAVLEEQARGTAERPAWLLDVYDHLGLVDKYVERLRGARRWRERAFAAELLGRVGNAKAVPALLETIQATRTEDADVREIALRALARIGDPRAVRALVEALKTAEPWLAPRIADILTRHGDLAVDPLIAFLEEPRRHPSRPWAANVLGEVKAPRAFAVLARGLGDPEDEMRAKCATAIARLGDRRAVNYLLEHLLSDPAPFVRARIAAGLGRFEDPDVTERLVRALGDPAWWVRMRSVEALEQIGPAAEGPLLLALDDSDSEIRIRAAVALERLELPGKLARMIERGERLPETMETLVKFAGAGARELLAELLLHPTPGVRHAVVTAVRRASRRDLAAEVLGAARDDGDPGLRAHAFDCLRALRVPETVPAALAGLGDQDERVRAAAAAVLGEVGGPEAAAQLRARTSDPHPAVRAAALRSLGLMRSATSADLEPRLGDPDPLVREEAARAAGEAALRPLAGRLAALLDDPAEPVRRAAAQALGLLGDREAVPALLRTYPGAPAGLRQVIAVAVGRLDPATVAGLLDSLVESRDTAGKLGAIHAFARQHAPALKGMLLRLAQDADPAIRAAVAAAWAEIGGPEAAGPLMASLADPDETVRATAAEGVGRLGLAQAAERLLGLLRHDPSSRVGERAALAIGLLQGAGGEPALVAACRDQRPVEVRAAAARAAGAFVQQSIVARIVEMPDPAAVREHLRIRLAEDPGYRLLARRLSQAHHLELRALGALSEEETSASLAEGMRTLLEAGERIRLVSGLRAFQGERSRTALLQAVRGDPSPEVRTAALTAVADLLDLEDLLRVATRAQDDPSVLVRRAAIGLFARVAPERAFPALFGAARADDDPAVLAAVAEVAERGFPGFAAFARALPADGDAAVLLARAARYLHHPELPRLLPPLARSGAPEVREAVAALLRHQPGAAQPGMLEALAADPAGATRREAAGAAAVAGRWDLLERMSDDPDAEVRREVALAIAGCRRSGSRGQATLQRLSSDPEMPVRAAAYVGRLLLGTPVPLPPALDPESAATALRDAGDLAALRDTARSAPAEDRRLAAALALALVQDEVAREVARTDPVPAIRHRVSGALELTAPPGSGAA
jgi:HEAT repeat protein